MKILLAVDSSKPSLDAVDFLVRHFADYREPPQVQLVTVHLPVPKVPGLVKAQVTKYYEEEGEACLAPARKKLDAAGIAYDNVVLVGQVAESLVKHAQEKRCDVLCIGTRGMSATANVLLGSTATKVLHLSPIPVLLVK
jgi:nucleotide-binding universal stress UspA family protein